MTKTVSLVLAYSLLINEFHILFNLNILNNKQLTSNLVFLLSVCLILRELEFFPSSLWRRSPKLCFLFEIPVAIIILELLQYYVWKPTQEYIVSNADALLVHLVEDRGLEWFVCRICCCGETSCSHVFADLLLKFLSFAVLISVCCFNCNK